MTRLEQARLERLRTLERRHFWSVGRDRLTKLVMKRFAMAEPVIDAGCGTGRFASRLAQTGRQVYWFDLGATVPPGFTASVCSIPFATASISTVLVRDVLEHVDDDAAMAEIARTLTPGGHVLVTVPAWPSLWSVRDEASGHLRRYHRKDLVELASAHQLEVMEIRGYQFFLLPLVMASRWWSRLTAARDRASEENLPAWLNRFLAAINLFEARWAATRFGPRTGSTLVMVARRQ